MTEEVEEEQEELRRERTRRSSRSRRRAYSLSLMGAAPEGGVWEGLAGSPTYSNALHHLWMMSSSRSSAPYLSSDESDSQDEDLMEELQELRDK